MVCQEFVCELRVSVIDVDSDSDWWIRGQIGVATLVVLQSMSSFVC